MAEGSKSMAVMRSPSKLTRAIAMNRPIVQGNDLMGSNILFAIRGVRKVQAFLDTTVIAVRKRPRLLLLK